MKCFAAAKSLQSCPTLCDPIDGSHQAPPSLGFSRQEHWSGLPFPSPMQESEKWKWSHSVMSNPSWSHGLQPTRLLHPWDFPGKSIGVGWSALGTYKNFLKEVELWRSVKNLPDEKNRRGGREDLQREGTCTKLKQNMGQYDKFKDLTVLLH